ncbi:ABC transporter F family member 5-like [Dorcoceras hygrometricum]|nr:ABC transporter F family member 5-like [Dorcoceras hygrometricum]
MQLRFSCPPGASPISTTTRRIHCRFVAVASTSSIHSPLLKIRLAFSKLLPVAVATSASTTVFQEEDEDIEGFFSDYNSEASQANSKRCNKGSTGASTISSGVTLENVSKSYKGATVLKNISWDVKKGEKVGLVGVNGAAKTTQMRIISGLEQPDSGNVIKVKSNMKIAFLNQDFEVLSTGTVKDEFLSAFKEEMEVPGRFEKVQKAIEKSVDDLELMRRPLDEFDLLQRKAQAVDLDEVDVKINKLMPELGFGPEDADRLVTSFSGGWQMRMSLGKILLQDPDLLLLDEPTNHLDPDTIEWLESYLNKQDVPMIIISHDRAFLDQLCTKIVETDMGVSRTYEGNYSDYVIAKAGWIDTQFAVWEKQQKKIEQSRDLICRLSGGANTGRASSAEKKLEKLQDEEKVDEPKMSKGSHQVGTLKLGNQPVDESDVLIECRDVYKSFGEKQILRGLSFKIRHGEAVGIIGPSGTGKSTILKIIAGLLAPDKGEVLIRGRRRHGLICDEEISGLRIGLVFQSSALFDSLSVRDNVGFLLYENSTMSDDRISELVAETLAAVGLKGVEDRLPSELSGGMKKRVALARSIIFDTAKDSIEPEVLLYDEPTAGLDPIASTVVEDLIRSVHMKGQDAVGNPGKIASYVVVTHQHSTISRAVDRLLFLYEGKVVWQGMTQEFCSSPNPIVQQVKSVERKNYFQVEYHSSSDIF